MRCKNLLFMVFLPAAVVQRCLQVNTSSNNAYDYISEVVTFSLVSCTGGAVIHSPASSVVVTVVDKGDR